MSFKVMFIYFLLLILIYVYILTHRTNAVKAFEKKQFCALSKPYRVPYCTNLGANTHSDFIEPFYNSIEPGMNERDI